MKKTLIFYFILIFSTSCRALPPLPFLYGGNEKESSDEAMFKKLQDFPWDSKKAPAVFTRQTANAILGESFFEQDRFKILPLYQYNKKFSNKTAGVRKLFRFYLAEADYVTGLTVFVHEAVHAMNWIDILDMEYNEFMSIVGELWLVQIVAKKDPDLAVSLLGRSMHLFSNRDSFYVDEEHSRARLYLAALLVDREPDEIYKWARDCSKKEFYKKVNKAIGEEVKDLPRQGIKAFAQRHFEGPYVETLLKTRDFVDVKSVWNQFQKIVQEVDKNHVFYDNIHWQLINADRLMGNHKEVIKRAELIWEDTKSSLLALAIAQSAYLSSCMTGTKELQNMWKDRMNTFQSPHEMEVKYMLNSARMLLRVDQFGLDHCFKNVFQWFRSSDFVDDKDYKEIFEDELIELINAVVKVVWLEFEKNENEKLLYDVLGKLDLIAKKMNVFPDTIYGLKARFEFYKGDKFFEGNDLKKALDHYDRAKKLKSIIRFENSFSGKHVEEARFWYDVNKKK